MHWEADGPGESVRDAIANAGVEPRLVNGILLRQVDGKVVEKVQLFGVVRA
jgi:hypothetical protein